MSEQPASSAPEREQGLKQDAIGFVDALVIGLASTAPAYSLAAVIGIVVVIAGVQAPAVLLASFVPMFFIAAAFYYMNRADQDCGTTFSWVTRALGPWPGRIGGWDDAGRLDSPLGHQPARNPIADRALTPRVPRPQPDPP